MAAETNTNLDRLFYPKNIAMVGASPKRGKGWNTGNSYIAAAMKQDFPGNIYPVHPKAETILGYKAYPNVRDIPGEIDLAVFTIPTLAALKVMEDCAAKGVKFVHLLTAGFTETGRPEHAELEKKLVKIAQKGGVRIIGPNCMGLYCPEGGIAWDESFSTKSGPIGFFSQSGQLASHFIRDGEGQGLAFSKAVSFGNASDLKAHHFLEYLGGDEKTKIIGSYLEGLKDGREFFETARKVTREKPLVIWKGGQTEGGSRATQSHTAAIAGSSKVWQAMCRQAGVISVHSMIEAVFTVSALRTMELPKGLRVAILGGAGGGSVTMTDMAEKNGLKVPHLSDTTVRALEKFVPLAGNSVRNPLDVFFEKDEEYMTLARLLREDPNIDAFIYSLRFHNILRERGRAGLHDFFLTVVEMAKKLEKSLFLVLESTDEIETAMMNKDAALIFQEHGIATFPSFEIAATVLYNLKGYHDYLSSTD